MSSIRDPQELPAYLPGAGAPDAPLRSPLPRRSHVTAAGDWALGCLARGYAALFGLPSLRAFWLCSLRFRSEFRLRLRFFALHGSVKGPILV